MSASVARGQVTTRASRGDASDKNVFEYSHCANVVHKGDNNRTHVGHNNQDNQGVIVIGGSAILNAPRESIEVLNGLRRAPAYYDSSLRKQAQECMPETRVAVLSTIYEWVDNHSADNPPIFWLHGPAGTGKSTIAHSVAVECRKRRRLGASFFFAHANAECGDADLFFSTIAYQLSKFDPDLQQYIIDGVRAHPCPADASIPSQFEEFILTPLRKLSNGHIREPIVVVIDAVDECSDGRKTSEILQLLSTKIPTLPLLLKFFVTSRPEPEIRSILHPDIDRISRSFDLLRDVDVSSIDEDIKHFLRFHLGRIGKEYDLSSWPLEEDVEDLALQAGALFIFAHTAIEYIRDEDVKDPESQLTALKNIDFNGSPAFNLHALYSRILRKALPETVVKTTQERVITIINTIVGLRGPLPLCAIERLLGLGRGVIRRALNRLRSIFLIPDNDEDTIQVIHPSFARYITDEGICTEKRFFVGSRQLHSELAKHCLRQMKTRLKQNICNFEDFSMVEAPIKSETTSGVLSEELKYSCQNFAAHVYSADWQDGVLGEMVAEWVKCYLLNWLEVLALIGSFRDALPSLRLLTDFYDIISDSYTKPPGMNDTQLMDITEMQGSLHQPLLADAISMVSESYDDIKRFPNQIYACLAFCPLESALFKQFSGLSTVRVLCGERKTWRPLLHAFKESDGDVINLAFSPDGTTLASRSSAGKVVLWNLETGESRQLTGRTLPRRMAFTFSPDGKYIAADGVVYGVVAGKEVLAAGVCSAFSPDGRCVAVGCANGIIRLYDLQAQRHSATWLGELLGHERIVTTLAFSSDNKLLASASRDDTIRMWSSNSHETVKLIPCPDLYRLVKFSSDGSYIAAHYQTCLLGKEFGTYVWVDIQTCKETPIVKFDNVHVYPRIESSATIFSTNSNYLASYYDNIVYVVRCVEGTQAPSTLLRREFSQIVTAISFTPDEQYLLVGNNQGLVISWQIQDNKEATTILDFEWKAHFWPVHALASSRNGNYFASASIDGSICVWNFSTSVDLHEPDLIRISSNRKTAIFAPNGRTVAIGLANTISKMDAVTGCSIFHRTSNTKQNDGHCLIFSADGRYLASHSLQELLLWDTGDQDQCTLRKQWQDTVTNNPIVAHALSPDATRYAVKFTDGNLWIYDLHNGRGRQVDQTKNDPHLQVGKLRFSTDSRHLVSCCGDIRMFDVEKGKKMDLNLPTIGTIFDCAFSPNRRHIALAHKAGLHICEYLAEKPTVKKISREFSYQSVEFPPDAHYILAAVRLKSEFSWQLNLFQPHTREKLFTIKLWSRLHVTHAMREFNRTGRLLNYPLCQNSEYEDRDFPYLLDKEGWVITASSKRLCRLPVANRGDVYDVNGNRIVVVSPEGKVTLIQFGSNPICISTSP